LELPGVCFRQVKFSTSILTKSKLMYSGSSVDMCYCTKWNCGKTRGNSVEIVQNEGEKIKYMTMILHVIDVSYLKCWCL
jgi:hypothetical protein